MNGTIKDAGNATQLQHARKAKLLRIDQRLGHQKKTFCQCIHQFEIGLLTSRSSYFIENLNVEMKQEAVFPSREEGRRDSLVHECPWDASCERSYQVATVRHILRKTCNGKRTRLRGGYRGTSHPVLKTLYLVVLSTADYTQHS